MQEWRPSLFGKAFTRSDDWSLTLQGSVLTLQIDGRKFQKTIRGKSPVVVHAGTFWTDITFQVRERPPIVMDGIPNAQGWKIANAIDAVVREQADAAARIVRRSQFDQTFLLIRSWHASVLTDVSRHNRNRRWMTSETIQDHLEAKPSVTLSDPALVAMLDDADIQSHLGSELPSARKIINLWRNSFAKTIATRNEKFVQAELLACQSLFNSVESMPLTDEQARAVICFDNRVQVVAAAGSGKTSTMAAKAAYAIERGLVEPRKILMLAFNDLAAKDLKARTQRALARVGRTDIDIQASTFHSFGSMVIGQATGQRRRIPTWMDGDEGIGRLSQLVDDLKDRDSIFRTRWDLFRIVFSRDLPKFGAKTDHEDWDRTTGATGFRTLSGDLVKSLEERTLADWLFYNGVPFFYERNYEHPTATADHSQYRPDFFYPTAHLYHEHFALNEKGQPPEEFSGYLDGVKWKRDTHKRYDTDLIETTSAQIRNGKAFQTLSDALAQKGIQLDPNPNRPTQARKVIEHEELVSLFRSFIRHAKSNSLTVADLHKRLANEPVDAFQYRHAVFIDLYEPIREAWEGALAEDDGIDYEDMLIRSAEALETGAWHSPYDLVMVDEFQDASWARARMALALVKPRGRFLFAVGDDWQSINRFAGADVSVMTTFLDVCKHGQELRLEQTFRCPQALCDASSAFVLKNPAQIKKGVRSKTPAVGPALQAFQVADRSELQSAIDDYVHILYQAIASGDKPPGEGDRTSIYVLGRYKKDEQYVPSGWKQKYGDRIDLSFRTIHSSKGAEADYVVLPGLVKRGFPSAKQDDPVLNFAMPSGDTFSQAEERRLFYVALTRARRSVAMFTVIGKVSEFLIELVEDKRLDILDRQGQPTSATVCPKCRKGFLVERHSRFGPFFGCTNYPLCKHTIHQRRQRGPRQR